MMKQILEQLIAQDNFRTLPKISISGRDIIYEGRRYLNLSSNDYLGISSSDLHREFMDKIAHSNEFMLSNPSSRLITGNSADYELLEDAISKLYDGRAVLVLGSGYLLNSGVLPAITTKGDLILADKLVHASIIDGLKLCDADIKRFSHNNLDHLEQLLTTHRDNYNSVWVVTESVFSMDGDRAPLKELSELKAKYNFKIYIDEAHAFGVYGEDGRGIASELGVEEDCDIIVATLGKATASQGAFIATDNLTKEFLINKLRTLIFSTALPPISLRWSKIVIESLPSLQTQRTYLQNISKLLSPESTSHIIPIMAGENRRAVEMSQCFREAGFWVTPIRYPTVPQGSARIRVSLNAAIKIEEIEEFKIISSLK